MTLKHEHQTFVLNTEDTFNKLELAAEEKAKSLYKHKKLEKSEKPLLAKLKAEIKVNYEKISQTELTDEAYRHPKYREWIEADCKASMEFSMLKDRYNNLVSLKDMRITEESSARYLINKK